MEANTLRYFQIEHKDNAKACYFIWMRNLAEAEGCETTEMLFLTSVGVTFLYWKRGGDVEGVERMKGSYPKEKEPSKRRH
jgi:hypothetical protein